VINHVALSVLLGLTAPGGVSKMPTVDEILERASLYVQQYEAALGAVLADEDYRQVAVRNGVSEERSIASDFFLLDAPWKTTSRGIEQNVNLYLCQPEAVSPILFCRPEARFDWVELSSFMGDPALMRQQTTPAFLTC
jgi:hypothetical protein